MRYTTDQYYKTQKGVTEMIDDRIRIGFVRCPKCRSLFGIYHDEFYEDGRSRENIFHSCGFNLPLLLKDWEEKDPSDRIL